MLCLALLQYRYAEKGKSFQLTDNAAIGQKTGCEKPSKKINSSGLALIYIKTICCLISMKTTSQRVKLTQN